MARVYAIEDGDLSKSIAVSRKTKFSDIAIDFKNRESTNSTRTDLNKVLDAQAVKQSVQNILTTGRGEKPFAPYFGSDLGYLLFSLDAEFDDDLLEEEIRETINLHEPRAIVEDVKIKIDIFIKTATNIKKLEILSYKLDEYECTYFSCANLLYTVINESCLMSEIISFETILMSSISSSLENE